MCCCLFWNENGCCHSGPIPIRSAQSSCGGMRLEVGLARGGSLKASLQTDSSKRAEQRRACTPEALVPNARAMGAEAPQLASEQNIPEQSTGLRTGLFSCGPTHSQTKGPPCHITQKSYWESQSHREFAFTFAPTD